MRCIIIDDEPLARDELEFMIQQVSTLHIVARFGSARQALQFLENNSVDLIFSDIEMPVLNGLQFAALVAKNTLTIFTTAYPQHALKGYELEALDYLVKPISEHRLEQAIAKAERFLERIHPYKIEPEKQACIVVRSDRQYRKIQLNEILFIEGMKDYVIIHRKEDKIITAQNLKTIHKSLPQQQFLRVSKSFIVNSAFIDSFDNNLVYLGGYSIPLSGVFRASFMKFYIEQSER